MLLLWNLFFLAISLGIMLPLGIRYGRNAKYSFGGSVGRAVMWSFVGSWSLVFFPAGHGAGALPLPSMVAVVYAAIAKLSDGSNFLYSVPHFGISPLVPIVAFVYIAVYTANGAPSRDA